MQISAFKAVALFKNIRDGVVWSRGHDEFGDSERCKSLISDWMDFKAMIFRYRSLRDQNNNFKFYEDLRFIVNELDKVISSEMIDMTIDISEKLCIAKNIVDDDNCTLFLESIGVDCEDFWKLV